MANAIRSRLSFAFVASMVEVRTKICGTLDLHVDIEFTSFRDKQLLGFQ